MKIRDLRHVVYLCRQDDVVEGTDFKLRRESVLKMHAMIEPKRATQFSRHGAAMTKQDERTHIIKARYHPEIDVTAYAWIYEERRKSAPRWFKILQVSETEGKGSPYFMFECRLTEKIVEPVAAPTVAVDLPEGVSL